VFYNKIDDYNVMKYGYNIVKIIAEVLLEYSNIKKQAIIAYLITYTKQFYLDELIAAEKKSKNILYNCQY
jgi:hypothetical protein